MNKPHPPFWLPTSNYYVLAVAISTAFFFLVWGILHDGGEETPWITAGVSASVLLCGAVVLRELILRRVRSRLLLHQRNLRMHVAGINTRIEDDKNPHKLTLEKNALILHEIKQKSNAARVLNKFSAAHKEVFELCGEYIGRNEAELKTVNAGSPRLAPLLKGRSAASEWHRYHLLRWAEIESRTLTAEAGTRIDVAQKIDAAQNALDVIESALQFYPAETTLIQSKELLVELVVSINVSHLVEAAEKAIVNGEFDLAKALYTDALFNLGRDNVHTDHREQAAKRIRGEIERISGRESGE